MENGSNKFNNEQFNIENDKLQSVLRSINEEIINYIAKRKKVVEVLLESREVNIEEYKDDEDKVAEYFDHERFIKEESYKYIDKKLRELNVLKVSPYFGKVSFTENNKEEVIYVGRFTLTSEGDYEPIIADWRAPICSIFYAGSLGEYSYEVPDGKIYVNILGKRQFIIKKSKLEGMFDTELDIKDDILQLVLSKNTGDKLRDIIMTIQQEQDKLIRYDKDKTIVVDGVAGSGKTTIALHRIAYLLYNYRKSLTDSVLILGPNSIFIDYISAVLPGLGETGVIQTTFMEFASKLLGLDNIMDLKMYMEKIISGDNEFTEDAIYKQSPEYVNVLDSYINELQSYYKIHEIKYFDALIMPISEIEELFNNYYKDMPLFRRSRKIKRIIFSKLKDARDNQVRKIEKEFKQAKESMSKEEYNAKANNLIYMRKNKIRETIVEIMKVKKQMIWIENPDILEEYNKINRGKELTFDDLAPIIYLRIKLDGLKLNHEYKQVVIDEAQDYSALQLKVIKELTKCRAMTIVGDSNQRIFPGNEISVLKLQNILPSLEIENFKLSKSYRSTTQIMTYANKFINSNKVVSEIRSGSEVVQKTVSTDEELTEEILNAFDDFKEKGYESAAVICRSYEETERIGKLIRKKTFVNIISSEDMIYSGGNIVIPSYFAKGLEFDCVIIIDDGVEGYNKLKYVMASRALHELQILKYIK
jgi:DNA helicase II / ATP-dependent DNA helicase PcrA